ncbi:MAG: MATE family efflux transporter [Candidatus Zophobacter franzmannii]|nr:MATE family efflux transporter [Candidatus Zophobacter franzmannii]
MKSLNEFETVAPWKLLLRYSIPAIVASSVHAIYNIVDRIYIGKALGTDAVAGLTITFPIFILSIALGVLLGNGSSTIISIRLGEKNKEAAENTLGNTVGLFALMGVFVSTLSVILLNLFYILSEQQM